MSIVEPNDPTGPDDGGDDAARVADDRVTHGLLEFLHQDSREAQAQRITRAMDRVAGEPAAPRPRWLRLNLARGLSVGALAVVVVAAVVLLGLPTERTAHALVESAIDAAQHAAERRYEIRIQMPHEADLGAQPTGVLDVQGEHVFMRFRTPHGHLLYVGRDDDGEWAIRPDGGIERFDPQRAWPRWINLGDGTLLVESVDVLLEQLQTDYVLELLEEDNELPALAGFEHVAATRVDDATDQPGPDLIDIWINPDTGLVERMEIQWIQRGGMPRDSRLGPPGRPRRGDGRPPHHRPPPRDGTPPPNHDRPPPRFMDEPPRFRRGHHPPPPRRIVFELVDPPIFQDGWFSPDAHTAGGP